MAYSAELADKRYGSVEQIIAEYASGKTLQQIADSRGIKHPAVWMRIRRRCGESRHRAALYQSLIIRIQQIESLLSSKDPVTKARARKQSRSERYRLSQLFPDLHPWPKRSRKSKQRTKKTVSIKDLAAD